jgi:hypothetical protein
MLRAINNSAHSRINEFARTADGSTLLVLRQIRIASPTLILPFRHGNSAPELRHIGSLRLSKSAA